MNAIVDFALPPRCAGCATIVLADRQLCLDCWSSLQFLTGAGCKSCGTPMDESSQTCAPCMANPPVHDGVRAAVAYGGVARDIAVRLKHGRRTGLAGIMAKAMARHVPEDGGVLVPVPLHRWRLWWRGFNQSALVARHLQRTNPALVINDDTLLRHKSTPFLRGQSAVERARLVKSVFMVAPDRAEAVKGKRILLVDDVHTSGATANACARALKRAGAREVIVLCWARVLREDAEDVPFSN